MSNRNWTQSNSSFNGIVDQVWEDGFSLNTGDRILLVDAYDLYGDFTQRYIPIGTRLTVSGEFEGGEFDAFAITLGSSMGGNGTGDGTVNHGIDLPVDNGRENVIRGTGRSDDLVGGNGRDRLLGLGGDDDLIGGGGNDVLAGGDGDDDLFGGNGNDILSGGRGQDDLVGGAGRDTLIGGDDRDTFILQPAGNDLIRDFRDGIDELGLSLGLRFNDLVLQQQGSNAVIFANGDRVATLVGVNANSITPADLD